MTLLGSFYQPNRKPQETRKCRNCFKTKPITEFYRKRPDGYQYRCKACNAEVVRGYKESQRLKQKGIDNEP